MKPPLARLCAQILRQQRAERGALQLASPEVKFTIDTETHDPLDVGMYQVRVRACARAWGCLQASACARARVMMFVGK